MLWFIIFLARFFPFWAIPLALVAFEVANFQYNRRNRYGVLAFGGLTAMMVLLSLFWLIFEGYWRAGPFVKSILMPQGLFTF